MDTLMFLAKIETVYIFGAHNTVPQAYSRS